MAEIRGTRWMKLAGSMLVLVMLLAACGNGEEAQEPAGDAEDAATEPPAADDAATEAGATEPAAGGETEAASGDLTEGTILLGGRVITWAPAYLADSLGYFEEEGLDIELVVSAQGAPAAMAALVSGDALSSMTGAPAAVAPIREGAPVQMLFNASVGYGAEITVRPEFIEETGVGPDAPLEERIAALEGATLGIYNPGGSIDQLWRFILPQQDIDPDRDVQLVALQNAAGQVSALSAGDIDAMGVSPPSGALAEAEGFGVIYIRGNEIEGLEEYPYLVGSARTADMEGDGADAIQGVIRALAKGMNVLRENPEEAMPPLREEFSDLDDATFEAAFEAVLASLPESPLITEQAYQQLVDFSEAQGNPIEIPYEELVAVDIVEEALAGME